MRSASELMLCKSLTRPTLGSLHVRGNHCDKESAFGPLADMRTCGLDVWFGCRADSPRSGHDDGGALGAQAWQPPDAPKSKFASDVLRCFEHADQTTGLYTRPIKPSDSPMRMREPSVTGIIRTIPQAAPVGLQTARRPQLYPSRAEAVLLSFII